MFLSSVAPIPEQASFTGKGSEYFRIWIVNLLLSVVTLGLYTPFAEVRLMKYVASTFTLVPDGPLDDFLAGERQEVEALGDEAVDMFDLDIAF